MMIDKGEKWPILIVDDEEIIHDVLTMNLRDMRYEDKAVALINAHTASEAKKIIANNPHIAAVILDVMMEQDDAGLSLVKFIREDLKNNDIRILLHTGQPGIAPKKEVAEKYRIDAYLDKNMIDNDDCYVAVRLALKSYQECLKLKQAAKKDDVGLMEDITTDYINLLADTKFKNNRGALLNKVNNMVNLAQEILASYALNDIKNDLTLGSTKAERLSLNDYTALIRIHDIKMTLSHTPVEVYSSDWESNFSMLLQGAKFFSKIEILPDACKQALQEHICAAQ